ncbi:unnamed protein product [Protopolystoma xenopodis]|uniref:Uncharacterized protein n=1 Tax=Protopolystoma xenopodis TaxID=117903 RepID=A0A3S5FF71_9PLAT|nr:unnamed protein product [Protopolystoma xenopodis]
MQASPLTDISEIAEKARGQNSNPHLRPACQCLVSPQAFTPLPTPFCPIGRFCPRHGQASSPRFLRSSAPPSTTRPPPAPTAPVSSSPAPTRKAQPRSKDAPTTEEADGRLVGSSCRGGNSADCRRDAVGPEGV